MAANVCILQMLTGSSKAVMRLLRQRSQIGAADSEENLSRHNSVATARQQVQQCRRMLRPIATGHAVMTDQKKVVSSDDRLGSVKVQIRSDDGVVPAEAVAAAGYIRKNAGIGAALAQRPVRRNARSFLTSMQCL